MSHRRAQAAIAIVFAVHGTVSGSFATRVPWIQQHLDLGAGALGLALLAPALGTIVAPTIATAVAKRFGTRAATRAGLVGLCAILTLPALAVNFASLFGVLLVYGVASGVADVSMKHQATAYEKETGRAVISRLHGLWSIGTLIGAGIGIVATTVRLDGRAHLIATGVGLLLVVATMTGRLPHLAPTTDTVETTTTAAPRRRFTMPSKALLAIGVVGFCATFAEAAAHSWSSVYIDAMPNTGTGTASIGFAVFVAAMAAGRFSGDALVKRFGPVSVVRNGAAAGAVGMALVVIAPSVVVAMLGFALIGIGIAAIVPVVVSAASRAGTTPGTGVFTVVTMTYAACLAAPGAIGGIAGTAGLATAFGVTAGITAVIVVLASVVNPDRERTARVSVTRPARIGARLAVSIGRPARASVRRAVTLTRLGGARTASAVTHTLPVDASAATSVVSTAPLPTASTDGFVRPATGRAPVATRYVHVGGEPERSAALVLDADADPAIAVSLAESTSLADTLELPRMPRPVAAGRSR